MKRFIRILLPCMKFLALLSVIAGILLMVISYYYLYYYTRPVRPFHPVYGHMNAGKTSFQVAMFSDCGLMTDPLKEIAADVTEKKPDFVVFLGDMAKHGTPEEWNYTARVMREAFGDMANKIYATPGNHDVSCTDPAKEIAFDNLFGFGDAYWKYGDTLFITLNSAGGLVQDQFDWLESVLKEERASCRRCVLMTHVPPVNPAPLKKDYVLPPEQTVKLQGLTDKYDINMIVCGHVHVYTDMPFGSKSRVIILPSSGQEIRDPEKKQLGYVRFNFKENGDIEPSPVYVNAGRTTDETALFRASGMNYRTGWFTTGVGLIVWALLLLAGIFVLRRKFLKDDTGKA